MVNFKIDVNGKFLIYQQLLLKIDGVFVELVGYWVLVILFCFELLLVFDGIFWISWVVFVVMLVGGLVLICLYCGSIILLLMCLCYQVEQVVFCEVSGMYCFELFYFKGWVIEEIVLVQDVVECMVGNFYRLYYELCDKVDCDQESGFLSLIGVVEWLEQSVWEQVMVCMVEINNYVVLVDMFNKVVLCYLWQSLCQQVVFVWGDFVVQWLVCCCYSESCIVVVMLGVFVDYEDMFMCLCSKFELVLLIGGVEEVCVFLSFGVSVCEQCSKVVMEKSLVNVVIVLCQVQQLGGGGYCVFQLVMLVCEEWVQVLLVVMDVVMLEVEFSMVYQFICDLCSGVLYGVEVLMCWYLLVFGVVLLVEFILLVECSECILQLGVLVFCKVVVDVVQWQVLGILLEGFMVYVNVLVWQVMNVYFFEQVCDIVFNVGVVLLMIMLEFIESLFIDDLYYLQVQFCQLSMYGFGLCLDDFGIGYFFLLMLYNFDFNCVKLDCFFILCVSEEGCVLLLLLVIIGIVCLQQMECVVEGVEIEEQVELL